jgi:PhnB protein
MAAKPIPDGYHTVTPYLYLRNATAALDYYKRAFGAVETFRMPTPAGKIGHAEMRIGNSMVMLADEMPEMGAKSPETIGGNGSSICLYVEDVDKVFKQAIAAGGKEIRPVQDQFYGDRSGTLADPYGHVWTVATHKEDVSPPEMAKRAEEFMKKMASGGK